MPEKTDPKLRMINLNMLPVLHAILQHRNLTRAAEELNLTQSAVSNILKRLREHFDDELIVRDGKKLQPTERARRLLEPLSEAVRSMERVVAKDEFDPATTSRVFRIATADHMAATMLPLIAGRLAVDAPRISIQFVTAGARSIEQLLSDAIDLIISPQEVVEGVLAKSKRLSSGVSVEGFFSDPHVCIMRDDGEDIRGLADYASRPHAIFALEAEFAASVEQSHLDRLGLVQFNRVITSEFTVLPVIVSQTDCVALIPSSIATTAARSLPIRLVESPMPVPPLDMVLMWNRRRDGDREVAWLRDLMHRCRPDEPATDVR